MGDKSHGTCEVQKTAKAYICLEVNVRLRKAECDFIWTKSCSNGIRGQLDPSEFKYVWFLMSKVQKTVVT